jgi:CBS domain-containing protein
MPGHTAADIMTRSVVTLSQEGCIYQAIEVLLKHKLLGALVVDETGRLVGILSEKDCLRVLVGGALAGLPDGLVRDYMTETG